MDLITVVNLFLLGVIVFGLVFGPAIIRRSEADWEAHDAIEKARKKQ